MIIVGAAYFGAHTREVEVEDVVAVTPAATPSNFDVKGAEVGREVEGEVVVSEGLGDGARVVVLV